MPRYSTTQRYIQDDSARATCGRYVAFLAIVYEALAVRLATRHKSRLNSFVTDGIAGNEQTAIGIIWIAAFGFPSHRDWASVPRMANCVSE